MPEAEAMAAALRRGRDSLEVCASTARVLTRDMDWQARAAREVHAAAEGIAMDLSRLAAMADDAAVRVVADQRERNRRLVAAWGL